jgi:hypothetical protein
MARPEFLRETLDGNLHETLDPVETNIPYAAGERDAMDHIS